MRRLGCAALALACAGLWWGTLRDDALDRSALATHRRDGVGSRRRHGPGAVDAVRAPHAGRGRSGSARAGCASACCSSSRRSVRRPQGAMLDVRARPVAPRGPETGFDERGWLARRGIHVVLRGERPEVVGRRGGIGGVADRLRAHVESTLARGTTGERRATARRDRARRRERDRPGARGCIRGDRTDAPAGRLGPERRDHGARGRRCRPHRRRRPSHRRGDRDRRRARVRARGRLAAVRRSRGRRRRARVARLDRRPAARPLARAWPSARSSCSRGCRASGLEPGFQLSFAAVAAIFVVLPRCAGVPDAYPIPRGAWDLFVVAVACGVVTAPIVWLHFGAVALWTVPANIAAEPAMPPLISLALGAAAIEPLLPGAATALAWLAGWCAAWIALVARVVAELAIGAGGVAARPRSPPGRRRRNRVRSSRASSSTSRLDRRVSLRGGGARRVRLRAPPATVVDATARAPDHVSRRRPGRRGAARGARRGRARRPGAAGGSMWRASSAASGSGR